MESEKLFEERKEKFIGLLKKKKLWVFGLLIVALILGIYIRSLPMQDHNPNVPGSQPGLWDITTNDWTLGPDLDPWLFVRSAGEIVKGGSLPKIDKMRYVPFGYETARETRLLPYMIAGTYYFNNIFTNTNIEFAGAVFPVVMFALTILSFFFFVKEIFIMSDEKSKIRANVIAIISTFFMIVMPIFLSRTVAGIPEKESAGFFFMFLSFYLFLKAWKTGDIKKAGVFGILAGISTALMGLIWGGVVYVFISISIATLIAFIINKVNKKEWNKKPVILGNWQGVNKGKDVVEQLSQIDKYTFKKLSVHPKEISQTGIDDFNRRKHQIYLTSDIFLQISLCEGNSYATLDALLSGIPVVSTDTGLFYSDIPDDCFVKIDWEKRNDSEYIKEKLDYAWAHKEEIGRKGREWYLKNCHFNNWKIIMNNLLI